MSGVRRPNTRIAAVEVAFVLLSAIAGGMGEPWTWPIVFALGNAAHWAWSRRSALTQISPANRPKQIAMALGVIAIVHAGVYGVGLLIGRLT
jgi:hypothetical protein